MKTKLFLKHSFFAVLWAFCALVFFNQLTDNENAFLVYVSDGRPHLGSFWSSFFLIYMTRFTVDSVKCAWGVISKQKEASNGR